MFHGQRKSAMCVKDGRVQRKNRCERTPDYFHSEMSELVIDRRAPGKGYKHVVKKDDVRRFVEILPHWDQLRQGLNAIVLDCGHDDCMGWHRSGVVAICAWDREIEWDNCPVDFHQSHAEIFSKLNVPVESIRGELSVRFNETTARAFLLIHVLVHELGHHYDRMTTKTRRAASRGESFAEAYARRHEDRIIDLYQRHFDL